MWVRKWINKRDAWTSAIYITEIASLQRSIAV